MGVGEITLTQQVCVPVPSKRGRDSDECARCGAEVKCVNAGRATVPIIGFVTCVNFPLSQLATGRKQKRLATVLLVTDHCFNSSPVSTMHISKGPLQC